MKRSLSTLLSPCFAALAIFSAAPVWAQAQSSAPKEKEKPAAVQPTTAQPAAGQPAKPVQTIEKKPAEKKPAEDKNADKAADGKFAEAGPNHKLLAQFEGEWETVTTEFGEDGKAASTDKGVTTAKMVMGGRFLDWSYDGRSHGKFFRASGMIGYSNADKRFEEFYAESSGTEIVHMNGSADASGKVFTFAGKTIDPETGKTIMKKSQITFESKDSAKEDVFVTIGGKDTKVAELVYTRATGETKVEKKDIAQPKTKPAPAVAPANKK